MAFDGIVIAALVKELKEKLVGGRIMKIIQPERDELIVTVKNYDQYRLLISADAGLPLIYLTEGKKEAPLSSPAFCMLLRKYIGSARILDISQPGLERVIFFDLEHLDEMGDLRRKRLVFELMGKHSNIILCDDREQIIDSIKRVPATVSSVREVLPGRSYFITQTVDKCNPLETSLQEFSDRMKAFNGPVSKAVYSSYTGISPLISNELCFRAGIDPDCDAHLLEEDYVVHLYNSFARMMEQVKDGVFEPTIAYENGMPGEFSALKTTALFSSQTVEGAEFESISRLLEEYYVSKNKVTRIRQRSTDIAKVISNAVSRASKKYDLQLKQLQSTEKRDECRLYGELLTTYGYSLEPGIKSAVLNNYYTSEDITVPLDPELSAIENAKRYYDRYSKLKRTYEALTHLIEETKEELAHLESIRLALDIAEGEDDLATIRDELAQFGYMKRVKTEKGKQRRHKSLPMHFVTEDGFSIYVGRNNYQNDELTFKFASGNDWWFHAKGEAGSHVILKNDGREIPDRVFEQAASAAAYFSKLHNADKAEIDYLEKKNVKKPNGAKPGFVVYYTNYSMMAAPQIQGLTQLQE